MKRVLRITVIIIPVFVLIIGVVLWRNHNLKIMNAEPEKAYNDKSAQTNNLPTDINTPKVTSEKTEGNPDEVKEGDVTKARINDTISPDKTDDAGNLPNDATLGKIAEQPTLSPEAAAAKKEYEKIHSEYTAVYNELQPLLNARPIDWDAIRLVNEKIKLVTQKRMDALQNYALYSDEALEKLIATIAQQKASAEIMKEIRAGQEPDYSQEINKIKNSLKDFETMSLEERRRTIEKLSDLVAQ